MIISELKYVGNTPHIYIFNSKPLHKKFRVLDLKKQNWYEGCKEGELFIFPDERNHGMQFNCFPFPILVYSEKNYMPIVGYVNENMTLYTRNWECVEITETLALKMRKAIEFIQ